MIVICGFGGVYVVTPNNDVLRVTRRGFADVDSATQKEIREFAKRVNQ